MEFLQGIIAFKPLEPNDLIALLAMAVSCMAAIIASRANRQAKQNYEREQRFFDDQKDREQRFFDDQKAREQRFFDDQRDRELSAQVAANYLSLEIQSSEIFKYTAENDALIGPLRGPNGRWQGRDRAAGRAVLLNLYYQSLNLFEVCARFRRRDMVEPEVFASWVAWFLEILEDDYFRSQWRPLIRGNYTNDIRSIFDVGVEIFEAGLGDEECQTAFYDAVSRIMAKPTGPCSVIAGWPEEMKDVHSWEKLKEMSFSNGEEAATTPATPPDLRVA